MDVIRRKNEGNSKAKKSSEETLDDIGNKHEGNVYGKRKTEEDVR